MVISRKKQFLLVFAAFFVLGAAFKVMVLVDGLTEVRPANTIPPVAGLAFGPVGALACALGNLAADIFGTLDRTSVLGVVGNFIAAYLPYRLWYLFSKEKPNLHRNRNILLYLGICLVSAFTVAWFLSFGLYIFFGFWIEQIYTYVFFNNFGFSAFFGMPMLIILTSDSININCCKPAPHFVLGGARKKLRTPVCALYLLLMAAVFVCVCCLHITPVDEPWLVILSGLSFAVLLCQLI